MGNTNEEILEFLLQNEIDNKERAIFSGMITANKYASDEMEAYREIFEYSFRKLGYDSVVTLGFLEIFEKVKRKDLEAGRVNVLHSGSILRSMLRGYKNEQEIENICHTMDTIERYIGLETFDFIERYMGSMVITVILKEAANEAKINYIQCENMDDLGFSAAL